MDYLKELESEAIHIFREVVGQFRKPAVLFSGGKDSTVLVHLAEKAFYPAPLPFPVLHIDTGHNFPEVLAFRDKLVKAKGLQLIVRQVEHTILTKGLSETPGKFPSRNALQSFTLVDAINELSFDACIGGGRRDEEKARAKERIFSIRDQSSSWKPYQQRPELWDLYNGSIQPGEHVRVFPISNWTELDVWQYILRENIEVPSLYFSHHRDCLLYNGKLIATSGFIRKDQEDQVASHNVRYRTVGDMTCTAAVLSDAATIREVIAEIEQSTISERGETRLDDSFSDAGMEDRKLMGYF